MKQLKPTTANAETPQPPTGTSAAKLPVSGLTLKEFGQKVAEEFAANLRKQTASNSTCDQ